MGGGHPSSASLVSSVSIPWVDLPELAPQSVTEVACGKCFLLYLRDLGVCGHCLDPLEAQSESNS